MALPIAVQLYSVREEAGQDYEGTVKKIAEMGYVGVEPAGYPGTTAEAAAKLYQDLGLNVAAAHTGLPVGDDANKVLDEMELLGTKYPVTGKGPGDFETMDKIKATCDAFNQAGENAAKRGMTFGIHNHDWEYKEVEGKRVYQVMHELLSPNVFFEIDTYWVTVGGCDAASVIKELGDRVKLLHIKDGPCNKEEPMTAVGQGKMVWKPIIEAATHAEWLIVELDRCGTDMMTAVKESIDYLRNEGLGEAK